MSLDLKEKERALLLRTIASSPSDAATGRLRRELEKLDLDVIPEARLREEAEERTRRVKHQALASELTCRETLASAKMARDQSVAFLQTNRKVGKLMRQTLAAKKLSKKAEDVADDLAETMQEATGARETILTALKAAWETTTTSSRDEPPARADRVRSLREQHDAEITQIKLDALPLVPTYAVRGKEDGGGEGVVPTRT